MSDPKPSQMVADRLAITRTVTTAVAVHGPEVAKAVEAELFPGGAPQTLTIAGVLAALGAALQRRADNLVVKDRSHTLELADDDVHRQKRESCIEELFDLLVGVRSALSNGYGAAIAGAYGLGQSPPSDASKLLVLAGNVEDLLRKRPLVEPPKKQSLKVDPVAAADDIKASALALNNALANVERERREAQITLGAKQDAITAWGTTYPAVADATAAFFALGGRQDLADKVRPTARRRAGLAEETDTETTSTADAPAQGTTPAGGADTPSGG